FDGQVSMADAHDYAVFGLGRDFEARGKTFANGIEGMITAHPEFLRQTLEDSFAGSANERGLSVHWIIEHPKLAAEGFYDSLQSKANAKDGDAGVSSVFHQGGHAEVRRATRAR